MRRQQIGGLDLVRFAAAMMVAVFHLGFWVWAFPQGQSGRAAGAIPALQQTSLFGHFGWVGVEIFFVISGFVIVFSAGGVSGLRFARSRLLRLAPCVLILAPVSAAAMLLSGGQDVHGVARNLLRTVFFYPKDPWVDSVYWTLGIEIAFYLCVGLLLAFRRFEQLIEPFAIAIGAASLTYWLAHSALPADLVTSRLLDLLLLHHGTHFAIGVLIWAIWQRGFTGARAALIAAFAIGAALQIAARADVQSAKTASVVLWWLPVAIWIVGVIAVAVSLRIDLGGSTLRTIGLMTYPLYLVHNVAGAALMGGLIRAGLNPYIAMTTALVAAVVVSWLTVVLAEPVVRASLAKAFDNLAARMQAPRNFRRLG